MPLETMIAGQPASINHFALVTSQLVGSLVVIALAGCFEHIFAREARPGYRNGVVASLALAAALSLVFCEDTLQAWGIPWQGISISATIWIAFSLDLVMLSYLVYNTGGIVGSPFTPFLILLPTNGILIGQDAARVTWYFAIVLLASFLLSFLPQLVNPAKRRHFQALGFLVFVFTIAIALISVVVPKPVSAQTSSELANDTGTEQHSRSVAGN